MPKTKKLSNTSQIPLNLIISIVLTGLFLMFFFYNPGTRGVLPLSQRPHYSLISVAIFCLILATLFWLPFRNKIKTLWQSETQDNFGLFLLIALVAIVAVTCLFILVLGNLWGQSLLS